MMKQLFKQVSLDPSTASSRKSSEDEVDPDDASMQQRFRAWDQLLHRAVPFLGEIDNLDLATPPATKTAVIPNLDIIIGSFEERVKAKTHHYHFKTYRNCFIASEAVDILVELEGCSRSRAVKIGQALQREYRLFEHVTKDHIFQDAFLFFRYFPKDQRTSPITADKANMMTLVEIGAALEKGVMVVNRRYHLKVYKECFVGSEAVDFLVKSGFAECRPSAVKLGRILFKELHLFEHSAKEKPFEDNYLFYHFTDKSHRRQPSGELTAAQALHPSDDQNALLNAANALEHYVSSRDHKWRGKWYKDCFIASQAVDFMIHSSLAKNRREAVQLGRKMERELNLFEPAAWSLSEQEFSDDYLLFRFTDECDRNYLDQAPSSSTLTFEQLKKIADQLKSGVKVQTHLYHARYYPDTFIGTEAVDFLLSFTDSRLQAVKLGRKLARMFGLFRHVTGDHELKDDYLFFQFCDNSPEELEGAVRNASKPLPDIARAFRQGVQVSTHTYHFKSYKETFMGTGAVDFLEQFCATRHDALLIGCKLRNEYNLFDHVTKDHDLKDERLFYRFNKDKEINGNFSLIQLDMDTTMMRRIAKDLEANIDVKDHKFHMRVFKKTFLGSEAVDYLVNSKVCKSREEAVEVGRALARTFNLLEHVTMDHNFSDEQYFFRFVKPSLRKLWVAENEGDLQLTPDEVWHRQLREFEKRLTLKSVEKAHHADERRRLARESKRSWDDGQQKKFLRAKSLEWMSSFRKMDPRYQILKFFTEVSQAGADEIEEKGLETDKISAMSKFFPKASVFTVWRPTSNEAIKKMMSGKAVGKGLDIKGKSAKRGKLSAFVPFLQISKNAHKRLVKTLPKHATVRLFFPRTARENRDRAATILEAVAEEMATAVKEAKEMQLANFIDGDKHKDVKDTLAWDMTDPSISYIDEYSPDVFGIEIPMRLFWEAYIVRHDISWETGSVYDTGRPSQPAFQDMNIAALLAGPQEGNPRAVLYNNADSGDPMNPLELLMAYEEDDRVKPVVSDFDCFLVGTRAVTFQNPLPADQLLTLKWCLDGVMTILGGPSNGDNWTSRWLGLLKESSANGHHAEFPPYGYGDPKSYSIMEHAVGRLKVEGGGAVRHGAECFNFYFPQELDDQFLVVGENIQDSVVPWKYMDATELQHFLSRQLDLGYTFPLNLKWVLCDPGWKTIYDKLLASQKQNVQDSLNVWYPPESGIREFVEHVSNLYPSGFRREVRCHNRLDSMHQSGTTALDLAMEELRHQGDQDC